MRRGPFALIVAIALSLVLGVVVAPTAGAAVSCSTQFSGRGSGSSDDPYLVASQTDLEAINQCLDKHFRQTQALTLTGEWSGIGSEYSIFTGAYDGGGFPIAGLTRSSQIPDRYGLFNVTDGATLSRINLADVDISVRQAATGSLVGVATGTSVTDCHASGRLHTAVGSVILGGLVGDALYSTITDSSFTGTLDAKQTDVVGGLVGYASGSTISNSSTGPGMVSGYVSVGGLVGDADGITISDSNSSMSIEGNQKLGGLVGSAEATATIAVRIVNSRAVSSITTLSDSTPQSDIGGLVGQLGTVVNNTAEPITVENSFAKSEITLKNVTVQGKWVGGLIGEVWLAGPTDEATITDSYAIGSIAAENVQYAGGLVGEFTYFPGSSISRSYAAVSVPSGADNGGLVGISVAPNVQGFWNPSASAPTSVSVAGTESTAAAMKATALYKDAGWAIVDGWEASGSNLWGVCPAVNGGYPYFLREFNSTPCLPGAPTAVSASGTNQGATVSWQPPTTADVTTVTKYEYQLNDGAWTDAGSSPLTLSGLKNGTTYSVKIRAVNAYGAGEASSAATFTPSNQVITPAPVWPKKLKHPGRTVVFSKWMITNAGQRVHPSATFTSMKSLRPSGDVRLGRAVLTKKGRFTVIVLTKQPVRVKITLHAKASTGYAPLTQSKVYRLK